MTRGAGMRTRGWRLVVPVVLLVVGYVVTAFTTLAAAFLVMNISGCAAGAACDTAGMLFAWISALIAPGTVLLILTIWIWMQLRSGRGALLTGLVAVLLPPVLWGASVAWFFAAAGEPIGFDDVDSWFRK